MRKKYLGRSAKPSGSWATLFISNHKRKMSPDNKLDNPVWHSLNEAHAAFSINYNNLKCYLPDYCPFGGYEPGDSISHHLEDYSALIDNFFIVGEKPTFPPTLELKNE